MLRAFEKSFSVAMLLYTTSAILPFLIAGNYPYPGLFGDTVALAIQTALYAVAFFLIALRWRSFLRTAWNVKWVLALLLVAFASTAWSQEPSFTLRRATVLCATTAFGIYLGSRFDVPEQLRLLSWTLGIVVCASFLCGLFLPQFGIDHLYHFGDWQGVFAQKNLLARAMVLATIVFYYARFPWGRAIRWLGIAGAVSLLFLSRSVTGAVVLAGLFASLPIYRLLRAKFTFAIPAAAMVVTMIGAGVGIGLAVLPMLLQFLHRNADLTGRTDLWKAVLISISKRPWLGYGFDAFWRTTNGETGFIVQMLGWTPLHSHNGFLELLLSLGFLGLGTFVAGYVIFGWRALGLVIRTEGQIPIWVCTYLLFMLVYNFTESAILVQNSIFWVLYTSTVASLYLQLPAKIAVEGFSRHARAMRVVETGFREQTPCV
jgi:O-antigen ligase